MLYFCNKTFEHIEQCNANINVMTEDVVVNTNELIEITKKYTSNIIDCVDSEQYQILEK